MTEVVIEKARKVDTVQKYITAVLLSALLCSLPAMQIDKSTSKIATHRQVVVKTERVQDETEVSKSGPAVAKPTEVVSPPTVEQTAAATPLTTDAEAEAKAFIYHKESSNNPAAENYLGCYGLGQDCNGIVKNKCGADYHCQDAFFTDYMLRRYGTWQTAKSHWLARVAINGRDAGNWW